MMKLDKISQKLHIFWIPKLFGQTWKWGDFRKNQSLFQNGEVGIK